MKEMTPAQKQAWQMRKRRVLIAIPHMGTLTNRLAECLEMAAKISTRKSSKVPWDFQRSWTTKIDGIPAARNKLCKFVLDHDFTDILFIDSDVIPDQQTLFLLMGGGPKDIVGGVYPYFHGDEEMEKRIGPIAYTMYKRHAEGRYEPLPPMGDNDVEVDAVGTGLVRIPRAVLENPKMHYDQPDDDGTPCIFKERRSRSGQRKMTDDIDFCERAIEAGYRIICRTGVKAGHTKTQDMADIVDYGDLCMQAGMEHAAREMEEMDAEPEPQGVVLAN